MAASFQEEASKTEYSKRKEMEAARAFKPGLGGLRMSLLVKISHKASLDSKRREISSTF